MLIHSNILPWTIEKNNWEYFVPKDTSEDMNYLVNTTINLIKHRKVHRYVNLTYSHMHFSLKVRGMKRV